MSILWYIDYYNWNIFLQGFKRLIEFYSIHRISSGLIECSDLVYFGILLNIYYNWYMFWQGKEFVTGSPGGAPEYFRIHINQYNNVETLTCLSKQVSSIGHSPQFHKRGLNGVAITGTSRFSSRNTIIGDTGYMQCFTYRFI